MPLHPIVISILFHHYKELKDACGDVLAQVLIAATYVVGAGGEKLFIGIQKNDLQNFPATLEILKKQQEMINSVPESRWQQFSYGLPFVEKTKSEILKLGNELGVPLEKTWSCRAETDEGAIHCGKCIGCKRRRSAFKEAQLEDKTRYNTDLEEGE